MIEREAKIVNPLGMHARPAAEFVKLASRFKCGVEVKKDDLSVNGKSIMGVMMLAAECGSSLIIRTPTPFSADCTVVSLPNSGELIFVIGETKFG